MRSSLFLAKPLVPGGLRTVMSPHLTVPRRRFAGRYDLAEQLGQGGSATVFRAYDHVAEREVALKALTATDWDERRWKQELSNMERLRTLELEHVLRVYAHGQADGVAFFTMRLCAGGSLQDRMRQHGPLALDDAVRLLHRLAPEIDRAHAHGLLHRDLKPSNLLYFTEQRPDWNCVLGDWGIAYHIDDESLTETNRLIGSKRYMSPQRLGGKEATASDDLYSLAQTIKDGLSGYVPTGGPPQRAKQLPAAVTTVLERAMHTNAGARHANVIAFATALGAAAHEVDEDIGAAEAVREAAASVTGSTIMRTKTRVAAPGMPGSGYPEGLEAEVARLALAVEAQRRQAARLQDQLDRSRKAQMKAEQDRDGAHVRLDEAEAQVKAESKARRSAERLFSKEKKGLARELSKAEQARGQGEVERARAVAAFASATEVSAGAVRALEAALERLAAVSVDADAVEHEARAAASGGAGRASFVPSPPPRPRPSGRADDDVIDLSEYRNGGTTPAAAGGRPDLKTVGGQSRSADRAGVDFEKAAQTAVAPAVKVGRVAEVVAACATLGALWGAFGTRLPQHGVGHLRFGSALTGTLVTLAICALGVACICRACIAIVRRDGGAVAASMCVATAVVALLVGHGAHEHHTSPQWLAPGQWYLVAVLLLLFSLHPLQRRGLVWLLAPLALTATLAITIPSGSLLLAAVPLGALLALATALRVAGVSTSITRQLPPSA